MKLPLLSLLTLALATPVLRAADVDLYAVTKVQAFEQTSTAAPTLLPAGAFIFGALVTPNTAASVTSATLRLPSLVVKPFGPTPGFGPLGASESFDSLAALTAVYGSGSYGFTINAVTDGTRTPTLSLTSSAYPNTPTVTNFTAAQDIDWTQDFTVTWGAYVGGARMTPSSSR